MHNQNEYLIENILPSQVVNLIGGPTGAGKTTWLFDTILQWSSGLPILGKQSRPVPWIYVAGDRKAIEAQRTLRNMGIDPARIPFIAARDYHMTLNQILDAVNREGAKLVVWENFGSHVEYPARQKQVQSFLFGLDQPIRDHGLTILGVMEQPKMKPMERYQNPRQRISGVATWGHLCSTIFIIEPPKSADPSDPHRTLYVCPHVGDGMKIDLEFGNDGRLHPALP